MPTPLRRGLTIASLCLCGLLLAAFASRGAPQPSSVAVVDLSKLTKNLDEAKILSDRLTQQAEDFKKKLQEVKSELDSVTKDLDAMPKEKAGTPEYLKLLARKYELEALLKARVDASQKLIDYAEGENMKSMFTKVAAAVERLGKERGFDVILWDDRMIVAPTIPATGAQVWSIIKDRRILYASQRVDITDDVLTQMNNEFKAGK